MNAKNPHTSDPGDLGITLSDWADNDPDGFNDALADVMDDEGHDLIFSRYQHGPMMGYSNVEKIITRMDAKLAALENSIMPPTWMADLRARRERGE